jgi:phosphatidate phosphatase PAH1
MKIDKTCKDCKAYKALVKKLEKEIRILSSEVSTLRKSFRRSSEYIEDLMADVDLEDVLRELAFKAGKNEKGEEDEEGEK